VRPFQSVSRILDIMKKNEQNNASRPGSNIHPYNIKIKLNYVYERDEKKVEISLNKQLFHSLLYCNTSSNFVFLFVLCKQSFFYRMIGLFCLPLNILLTTLNIVSSEMYGNTKRADATNLPTASYNQPGKVINKSR
jgi:hypothetical protein